MQLREYKTDMSRLLFERIYRLLHSHEMDIVVSTKTGSEAGYIDYETNTVYLNPHQFPIEETFIHEFLHLLRPDSSEEDIIAMSALLTETMSDKRRTYIVDLIKNYAIKCTGVRRNQLYPTLSLAR